MNKLITVVAVALLSASAQAQDASHIHNTVATEVESGTASDGQPMATDSAVSVPDYTGGKVDADTAACADKMGVARTIELDTTGGGAFGEQYPHQAQPLLQPGEVILTFDDGPHPTHTREILDALAAECTKATFFYVGRMMKNFPEMTKAVQAEGHTVGTHTYSHRNLGATSQAGGQQQIESAINVAQEILPGGVAPFFRFPYLSDPKRMRDYLAKRNIAVFGIDVDSYDWRVRNADKVIRNVLAGLERKKGGILLFHDIHSETAKSIPRLLTELKARGYKVVHVVPKSRIETVAVAEPVAATSHGTTHRKRKYKKKPKSIFDW